MTDQTANIEPAKPAVVVAPADPRILSAYKKMLVVQFSSTVAMMAVLIVTLLPSYVWAKYSPPLLLVVMEAGIMGALFSALMRLYNVDQAGTAIITPTINALNGWYITMYALVPPIIGAIAAVMLYLVFIAKFFNGGLFPEISCTTTDGCKSILDLMRDYWPSKPEDYGKALVWSFAAGFSERLVPDLLQSLVTKGTKASGE